MRPSQAAPRLVHVKSAADSQSTVEGPAEESERIDLGSVGRLDRSQASTDMIHSDLRRLPFLHRIGKALVQVARIEFKVTLPP